MVTLKHLLYYTLFSKKVWTLNHYHLLHFTTQCWNIVQWFGTIVFLRPSVKVWKLNTPSSHPYHLSCYRWHAIYFRFGLCSMLIAQILSLHSRREEANICLCLAFPLAFFPYYFRKEMALLLDWDLQQYSLSQLPGQNVFTSATLC